MKKLLFLMCVLWLPLVIASQMTLGSVEEASEEKTKEEMLMSLLNVRNTVDLDNLARLIVQGVDVNCVDEVGMTAVKYASYSGHEKALQYLLEHGATLDNPDDDCPPLWYAVDAGHAGICEILIESGCNTDPKYPHGKSALMTSVERGDKDVCKVLIDAGYDVNDTDDRGWTPLRYAVGNKKIWDLLIENGADKTIYAKDGLFPEDQWKIEEALKDVQCLPIIKKE